MVLLWGLTEHFCGYFGLWLVASGKLALPYWAMVGLTVMAFNGSNWIDTACIATNVHNFPHDRGTVVGTPHQCHSVMPTLPQRDVGDHRGLCMLHVADHVVT